MSLKAKLGEDLKSAMRERDSVRLDAIRSIRAAITQREVDTQKELEEAAILDLIRGLRKQRIESIEQYRMGGREDLVEKEEREKQLLEAYLPAAPDAAAVEQAVRASIEKLGATSVKEMGKVMAAAKDQLPGVDGKVLSEVVKKLLAKS
ncbi:MAG TPA: GatB/YqeY domain-containing protein [Polyangiales bacterium]